MCSVCWVGVYALLRRRGSKWRRFAEPSQPMPVVSPWTGRRCRLLAASPSASKPSRTAGSCGCRCCSGRALRFYFALPSEPLLLVAVLPAVAALAVHVAGPRTGLAGIGDGRPAGGDARAGGRQAAHGDRARAGAAGAQVGPIDVYGHVELVEPRAAEGQRLTIRVTAMEKHEAQAWPARVRVRTMAENAALKPGDAGASEGDAQPAARAGAAGRL